MIRNSIKYLIIVAFTILVNGCKNAYNPNHTNVDIAYEELLTGFSRIPKEARLRSYWWWLNSMATKESITRDLEQMKAKGYGGASIVDAGSSNYQVAKKTKAGPVFMSPEWMERYQHAVKEADRLGIE